MPGARKHRDQGEETTGERIMRVMIALIIAVVTVLVGFFVMPPLIALAVPAAGGLSSATGTIVGLVLMLLPFALAGSVLGSSDTDDPFRLALLFTLIPWGVVLLVLAFTGFYQPNHQLGVQVRQMISTNGWFGMIVSMLMLYLLAAVAACVGVWISRTIRGAGRSRMTASG